MKKFYLWYSVGKFDPWVLEQFDNNDGVERFMNRYAENQELKFTVVAGVGIKYAPAQVVMKFARAQA